ncbi:MAG: 50S ribosomal protein L7/L12 [Coprothermobacterota bacterium]|nr:50S ribosomal protein L7/L12 [Caldisericota bacterium]MDI6869565.1 50S ribosomal protein L7/L12 [Coprothermobacterota bacterium]
MSNDEIIEAIKKKTILEIADLAKRLQEEFGVTAVAPVAAAAPAAAQPAQVQEEQTEFDVILTDVGSQKIQVLKVVRELSGLGLKEAKDLVDSVPKPVKEKVSKEEAQKVKEALEAVGAKVEIK